MSVAFRWMGSWLQGLGQITFMAGEVLGAIFHLRVSWGAFIYQLYAIGVKSQPVVLLTGAATGMVLAAQTYYQFHQLRLESAVLTVVSIAMSSELGPVLTGLMVGGRVGAAMAAELGTMRVTEQIDALRTLATHPVDFLAAPRVLATVVALPLLTAESISIGIGAAYLLAVNYLKVDSTYAVYWMRHYTFPENVITGMVKAFIFGAILSMISCYKGMTCREGAEGVGRATTEAVVYSAIAILVSNFFLTLFLNYLLLGVS
jgi:phospholipid/cholesterol/gamma-HCH transport system permease protein